MKKDIWDIIKAVHENKLSPIDANEKICAMFGQQDKSRLENCWDAAIKAHDERGHVHSRSWCDFDDYWENLIKE